MESDSRQVVSISGLIPRLGKDVWLAPGARVVGDVRLGERVSVWYNAVVRGDIHHVSVGAGTNIQDNCTLHVDDDFPCIVGRDVVVGHAAVLHGCTVGDGCIIGMSATVLNGAHVGARSVVAAGAVVPPGKEVPSGHVAMGVGAKVIKPLADDFWETEPRGASKYRRLAECQEHGEEWRWPDPDWERRDAAWLAARRPPCEDSP